MKIFCTGNIERKTVAYGLSPDYTASLSTGWDFTNSDSLNKFQDVITEYNVFVNSAFIAPGVQQDLLNRCHSTWTRSDIKGHIINIGTTLENTDDTSIYAESKRKLRKQSLLYSDQTGLYNIKTTYIILGGIGPDGCDPIDLGNLIKWVISQPYRLPVIQMDSVK